MWCSIYETRKNHDEGKLYPVNASSRPHYKVSRCRWWILDIYTDRTHYYDVTHRCCVLIDCAPTTDNHLLVRTLALAQWTAWTLGWAVTKQRNYLLQMLVSSVKGRDIGSNLCMGCGCEGEVAWSMLA